MGKKQKEELPDYTVANMDMDGMPWNSRRPWQILPGDPSKRRKEFDVKVPESGMESDMPDNLSAFENPPMTKEERRGMIWLSFKASLTVGSDLRRRSLFVHSVLRVCVAEIKEILSVLT